MIEKLWILESRWRNKLTGKWSKWQWLYISEAKFKGKWLTGSHNQELRPVKFVRVKEQDNG